MEQNFTQLPVTETDLELLGKMKRAQHRWGTEKGTSRDVAVGFAVIVFVLVVGMVIVWSLSGSEAAQIEAVDTLFTQ